MARGFRLLTLLFWNGLDDTVARFVARVTPAYIEDLFQRGRARTVRLRKTARSASYYEGVNFPHAVHAREAE